MMNNCRVRPISVEKIAAQGYCAAVGTVGFEKRSRFFFEKHEVSAKTKLASGFLDRNVMSFDDNKRFFQESNFVFRRHSHDEFGRDLLNAIRKEDESAALPTEAELSVCIDISAMDRQRMAQVIEVLLNTEWRHQLHVDFVYCVAAYSPPPNAASFIAAAGPISGSFSGWSLEPDTATCAIFGVGYEPDRVVGAIEYVEPGFVWAFVPDGPDPRFAEKVNEVNKRVWRDIPEQCIVHYKLGEPFNTFVNLESLVFSLKQRHRPILIPFGPKIFTIQCLLVAAIHSPDVAVWRVSGGEDAEPEDREASGEVYALRVVVESKEPQL